MLLAIQVSVTGNAEVATPVVGGREAFKPTGCTGGVVPVGEPARVPVPISMPAMIGLFVTAVAATVIFPVGSAVAVND